jgi:hypothetical protein
MSSVVAVMPTAKISTPIAILSERSKIIFDCDQYFLIRRFHTLASLVNLNDMV